MPPRPAESPQNGAPILVTGGAGFIGSHVVDQLLGAGHRVRILDVRPSPYHAASQVETIVGDVRRLDDVLGAVAGCQAIVHLAAAADVGEVAEEPVDAEHLNVRGTVNVLEGAARSGVGRVIYASTIWVYSDVDAGSVDEESLLPPPAHMYTATKLAGELYCRSYRELYGVDSTILRFGIPYGPRARPAAVVPMFLRCALAGEPLTIAGGGEQSRRFVYVEDLADGVLRSLAPHAANRTYNLVGGEDVSIREIAEAVTELVGDAEIVHTEGRQGDFRGVEVSGHRAERELGWVAATPFREGPERYLTWYQQGSAESTHDTAVCRPSFAGARLSSFARLAGAILLAVLAGALVGPLARIDAFDDPARVLGSVVLLCVPVALIAGLDWSRTPRRAASILGGILSGVVLSTMVWPEAGDLWRFALQHDEATTVSLLTSAAIAAIGARAVVRRRVVTEPET